MPQHFPEPIQTIHDYIQYFGLVSLNFIYLESRLRACLRDMARVRSKWPITAKRMAHTCTLYEETTLGGLVTEFENNKGPEKLVANLRALLKERNEIFHSVFLLTDIERGAIPLDRVRRRTNELKALSERVQGRMHAVMKFGYPLHVELARLQAEHHSPPGWTPTLAKLREMVKDYPDD